MEPLDWATRLQRVISWAVRVTAGLMLVYMLGVVMAENGMWPDMFSLPDVFQTRWGWGILITLALMNLLAWPLWCGLANRALQSRVHPDLKNSPVMAAVWFIFPGAFLFVPWAVVREIYLASEDPTDWVDRKAPIVGCWWWARLDRYDFRLKHILSS